MFRLFKKQKPKKSLKKLIVDLDLKSVEDNMFEKYVWGRERIQTVCDEYRRFLLLIGENPRQSIVPWTQDLDDFWHQHILDTRKYIEDCILIFGEIIHHDPNTGKNPIKHKLNEIKTAGLRSGTTSSSPTDFMNTAMMGAVILSDTPDDTPTHHDTTPSHHHDSITHCASTTHCSSSHDSPSSCSSHSSCSSSSCSSSSCGSSCGSS